VFQHAPCGTTVRRHPRSCASEGNGRSKENDGKNKGDQDLHSEISLSVYGTERNVTGGGAEGTFVLDLYLAGQGCTSEAAIRRVPLCELKSQIVEFHEVTLSSRTSIE
jgi:hypothetical protein